jgi:hypothetical protein
MNREDWSESEHTQTTLYDVAGLLPVDSTESVLEEMAKLTGDRTDAYRVRKAIALEALADESFRHAYDKHLTTGAGWREDNHFPILPAMPAAGWGTDEMATWIEQTKNIIVPTRRDPRGFEKLPTRARTYFSHSIPTWLWCIYMSLVTLLSAALGAGILSPLYEIPTLGYPAVAAIGAFLGSTAGYCYQVARQWQTRAILLFVTLFAGPLLFVSYILSLLLLVAVIAGVLTTSILGTRAEFDWASEPILPQAPYSPWAPIEGVSATRLGAGTSTPAQAAAVLRAWAGRVGFPVGDADDDDLVAAVITADAWAFAIGADSVSQAANFGPASLGAISASISRAAGFGEDPLPMLPGEWASSTRMPGLREACLDWKSWAIQQLGRERGLRAIEIAAADLCWGGGGEDRLTRLARYILGTLH